MAGLDRARTLDVEISPGRLGMADVTPEARDFSGTDPDSASEGQQTGTEGQFDEPAGGTE